jgi:hypothetical protein
VPIWKDRTSCFLDSLGKFEGAEHQASTRYEDRVQMKLGMFDLSSFILTLAIFYFDNGS